MTKAALRPGIISKLRAGQPLSLRDRLRLRRWQRQQQRRYRDWLLGYQAQYQVPRGVVCAVRIALSYAVGGFIVWLATPVVGLGFALLLAMLAWIIMGAIWLS